MYNPSLELQDSEQTKDIEGYEGLYAITTHGRVYSYPKLSNNSNGCILKPNLVRNTRQRQTMKEHYAVALWKGGKRKRFQIHRLVAEAFLPNPEKKPQVNHRDGNSLNNHVDNLEWCTQAENMAHATQNGMMVQDSDRQQHARQRNGKLTGKANGIQKHAKFTFNEAECIRQIYEYSDATIQKIADAYHVCRDTISKIINDKTYKPQDAGLYQ